MNQLQEIDVRNFKRIRKAHLSTEGKNTIVISGDNASGKSSFLDAIAALFGGKDKAPAVPVRKGAKEATIIGRLTTKAGISLKATVTFSSTGTRRLVVEDANGKTQAAPQALLDAFWSETSFDPSLFLAAESKDQVVMLKKLLGLDFTKLDKEKEEKYAERTNVNRDLDRTKALAVSLPRWPEAPESEISSADVLAEINQVNKHNATGRTLLDAIQTARSFADAALNELNSHQDERSYIKQDIERMQEKLRAKEAMIAKAEANRNEKNHNLMVAEKLFAEFKEIDPMPIQIKLSEVEGTNRKVRANQQHADAAKAIREKTATADKLTERIEEIDAAKEELLQKAPFPIPGMSINETGVILDGLPLEQASDSQKIAIGVEMAAILNPDKPLMLIKHGNLFTPHNFKILDTIAEKRGLTCVVEIPSEKPLDNSSLHFIDGVADSEASPETPAELPLT